MDKLREELERQICNEMDVDKLSDYEWHIVNFILSKYHLSDKSKCRVIDPRRIIGCGYCVNEDCLLESKRCIGVDKCKITRVIVEEGK